MLLPQVTFDDDQQRFTASDTETTEQLVGGMTMPLSATFQLTRNCNFKCVYCSEPPGIRTRTLGEVLRMIDKLAGMRRIIFSGGEPMAYKHFWTCLEHAQGKFERIVLSTNASMITRDAAARLRDLVDYVDITVDGPRRQHNDIRGQYDKVIRGLSQDPHHAPQGHEQEPLRGLHHRRGTGTAPRPPSGGEGAQRVDPAHHDRGLDAHRPGPRDPHRARRAGDLLPGLAGTRLPGTVRQPARGLRVRPVGPVPV